MKRNLLKLTVSISMIAFLLSRSNAFVVFAEGCGYTEVDINGATCSQSGGSSVTTEEKGGIENSGLPGNSTGNNNDYGNNGNGEVTCTPGTLVSSSITLSAGSSGITGSDGSLIQVNAYSLPDGSFISSDSVPPDMCYTSAVMMDSCTGQIFGSDLDYVSGSTAAQVNDCPTSYEIPEHPCDEFIVSGSGVTCTSDLTDDGSGGSSWEIRAHAGWPGIEIHARPFPITLVDWDSLMRVAGLGSSSGSGHLAYAQWGGGSRNSPGVGDWRDVVLRLEIKPITNWADVYLKNIGLIRMPIGRLHTFQWNLPSHPAAGGGPLAGEVGQLEELEADTPLYSNWTRAPYLVYCTLEYYEWESSCVSGPDEKGGTNCRRDSNGFFTGHREWGWKHHSQTVPIPPTAAHVDLPASFLADLNGDGVPDAYWGRTTLVRRMDDAGRVDNPEWAHTYSWPGSYWYWAVREAQGQVGWPGVPVGP